LENQRRRQPVEAAPEEEGAEEEAAEEETAEEEVADWKPFIAVNTRHRGR
jgi:hypothetical protein